MNTPTIALAWELWRKNRRPLIIIPGVLLFFIFAYPLLCAWADFNPRSPDVVDEFGRVLANNLVANDSPPLHLFLHECYILFLADGPVVTMVFSLVYVVWMFTCTGLNPKIKDPMAFHAHWLALPVSTAFLFRWIVFGGLAAILVLWAIWVYCVRLPHFAPVVALQNCFGWMTLLVLAQATVWSLAAWPITRMVALIAIFFLYLLGAGTHDLFRSPLVLPPLFLLGMTLAWAGLRAMRHGQWQGLAWQRFFVGWMARTEWRGPVRFRSPAHAQGWFEWRRWGAGLCIATILLALVPVGIALVCVSLGCDPLSVAGMNGFAAYLACMPPFIFFILGIGLTFPLSQGERDQSFVLVRPLTSGALVMPLLRTTGLAALVTWAAVWVAMGSLPWLGDFHAVVLTVSPIPGFRVAVALGLMFLTWRLAVINLWFGFTGHRWITMVPILLPFVLFFVGQIWFHVLDPSGASSAWLWRHVTPLAMGLLVMKFLLAAAAFRACLQRRLLTKAEMVRYLMFWGLLVAGLLGALFLVASVARPPAGQVFRMCLAIVYLVPLARIGFAPLALAWSRHAR